MDTVSAALHPVLFALFLCASCFFLFADLFKVVSPFLHSSWEQFPAIAWAAHSFHFPQNMSETDNGQTVTAAAATQVKLCPHNEEEPAIWFRLIEAQFAAAGIKSQKLRYTNALASLPNKSFGTF
jgi:hypothetical protein